MPCPVVIRQPILDKAGAIVRVARLKKTMNTLVRCMRVAPIAGERALDQLGPLRDLTGFDVGPAEITEKPPIVAPMRRQFLEQSQLRLMMIAASAKPQ